MASRTYFGRTASVILLPNRSEFDSRAPFLEGDRVHEHIYP
jgi:hypothetical protein